MGVRMRFFGAYVQRLSCSVSWGANGGSLQMTLVEDVENGITATIPPVGTGVNFKRGSFYFGGILQRASYKESISGRTYDVIIESPAKLLDGIQVILSDFNGTWFSASDPFEPSSGPQFTNQIYNVYNVYAHEENYSNGGFFGRADVNSAGFPARNALQLISDISYGNSVYGGPARFGNQYYNLDFSQIINLVDSNLRIKGPVQSVTSILEECGEASGFDYYPELQTNGVIVIRAVLRNTEPDTSAVANYVNEARNSGFLISSDIGYEYSSPVTQRLVVGGPATRFSIVPMQGSKITAVWGKTANNIHLVDPSLLNPTVIYNNPTHLVPILLDEYSGAQNYVASIFELRMATGGKDCWETFKIFETMFGVEQNGFNNLASCPWVGKAEFSLSVLQLLSSGYASGIDLEPTSASYINRRQAAYLQEQGDKIFAAVSRVANNFFGQVFALELTKYEPGGQDNNIRFIRDDIQYESQWDIADSAYVDYTPFADVNFYDGSGRLKNGAAWPANSRADYSALGSDWAITPDGGIATTKGGPDKDIYWINNKPYVILRSGGQVKYYDGITTPDFGLSVLVQLFTGSWLPPTTYLSGGQNMQISIPPAITYPTSFGLAEQSNTYSWGPWWAWSTGYPGKSEVVFDESLVPETFGDFNTLDQAALSIAAAGQSQSTANSTGSVQVTGLPAFNLADRLSGSGPYLSGIDINAGVDGETVTYKFNNWTPQFGKMSKANIDRVANIRKGSIALAQRNRSQIQKRPLPKVEFQKSDFGELAQRSQRPAPNMIHSFINQLGAANL